MSTPFPTDSRFQPNTTDSAARPLAELGTAVPGTSDRSSSRPGTEEH